MIHSLLKKIELHIFWTIIMFVLFLPGILLRLFLDPNSSIDGEGWPRLGIWAACLTAAGVIFFLASLTEAPLFLNSVKKRIIWAVFLFIIGVLCVAIGLSVLNNLGN